MPAGARSRSRGRPARCRGPAAAAAAPACPGKLLLRHGAARDRAAGAPARPRVGRRQRDQRQDDDRRDDRRRPRARPASTPVHNRAGANMPGGVATALLEQTRRRRSRARDRPVRGRRGLAARRRRGRSPRTPCCSATSSATSSTATASSRSSPTTGARWSPSAPGGTSFVLNADDPLVADLGRDARRARARERVTYFGLEDRSHALRAHRARLRRQALPPLRRRVPLLGRLPRPPRRLRVPALRQRAPAAVGVRARASSCAAWRARGFTLTRAGGRGRRVAAAPRPLQRLQRARGGRLLPRARASTLERGRGAASSRSPPRSAARSRSTVGGRRLAILLVKNPAGANEVFRTLRRAADGDGGLDVWMVAQRPHRRRARHLVDLGRRLRDARAARRPRRLLGHARRGAGAAPEVRGRRASERLEVVPSLERGFDRALADSDGGRCTRCPPTPRCSSCATCSPAAATRRRSGNDRHARSGTTSSAAPTPPTSASGRSCRATGASVLDLGCGTGRVALHLARRGHRVTGVDLEPELLDDARVARRAACADRSTPSAPTRATSTSAPQFDAVFAPMQLAPAVHGRR